MCWRSGKRSAPTSTITSRSTVTTTAFPTSWPASSWRPATPLPRSRSFTAASAWPRMPRSHAAYRHTTVNEHMPKSHQATSGVDTVAPDSLGRSRWDRRPRKWFAPSWKANRIRRWAIAPAWESCVWAKTYSNRAAGSGQPARPPAAGLLLSESEVDSGTRARPISRCTLELDPDRPARDMKTCAAPAYYDPPTTLSAVDSNPRKENAMLNQPTIWRSCTP